MSKLNYFSKVEKILWCSSIILIFLSFFIFDRSNIITLIASIIGATSLIFNAKGNPIGPFLAVIFSILYSIISFSFSYYGEMITYLCMTAPMSVAALISWLKNPYNENKSEVRVNSISKKEIVFLFFLAFGVTFIFYFILKYFNTANLFFSTLSITTSFMAVYLTARRSPFYAIAYCMNDIILIVMWILASFSNRSYISVCVCFIMFLANDIYGFWNWNRMKKRQS